MRESEETLASENMTVRLAGKVGACVIGWLNSRLTDLQAAWLTFWISDQWTRLLLR